MLLRSSIVVIAVAVVLLHASCAGRPSEHGREEITGPQTIQPADKGHVNGGLPFDPGKITEAEKEATFTDIRAFIASLNAIIQHKDFEAWLSHLSPDYIDRYSDPAVLAQISEYPVLERVGIKLQSLKDYFVYVVYPSRQNDRVDDIEFVGEQRVKAITIGVKGDRQILYNLEKSGDTWKIGIGR